MIAQIKHLYSHDVDNLEKFHPQEEDNLGFLLQLIIGPKGSLGEESFDVMICTPKWLLANHRKDDIIFARHYMIVCEYNYERIVAALKKRIETLTGDNWEEIATKIVRIGHWKFEDYQP